MHLENFKNVQCVNGIDQEEDSCWKWKKPPPPSRKKVQIEEHTKIEKSSKGIRKF